MPSSYHFNLFNFTDEWYFIILKIIIELINFHAADFFFGVSKNSPTTGFGGVVASCITVKVSWKLKKCLIMAYWNKILYFWVAWWHHGEWWQYSDGIISTPWWCCISHPFPHEHKDDVSSVCELGGNFFELESSLGELFKSSLHFHSSVFLSWKTERNSKRWGKRVNTGLRFFDEISQ